MNSAAIFVILGAMIVNYVIADPGKYLEEAMKLPEVQKCMESTGFDPATTVPKEITPDKLCFMKCLMEETGVLDANGETHPDKLDSLSVPVSDNVKDEAKGCLSSSGKIESCGDMEKVLSCMMKH